MYLSTSGVRNLCASRQRDPYFSFFLYICSFGSEYVHGPPVGWATLSVCEVTRGKRGHFLTRVVPWRHGRTDRRTAAAAAAGYTCQLISHQHRKKEKKKEKKK